MKKIIRSAKNLIIVCVIILNSMSSFAAVGANDGSAFITKAEFDSIVNTFNEQMDGYEKGLETKIDGAIANYLASFDDHETLTLKPHFIKVTGESLNITCRKWDEFAYGYLTPKFTGAVSYSANLNSSGVTYGKTGNWNLANSNTNNNGKRILVTEVKDTSGTKYYYAGYTTNYGEIYDISWSYLVNNKDDGFVNGNHYIYPFVFKGTQQAIFEGSNQWSNFTTFMHSGATMGTTRTPTGIAVNVTLYSGYKKDRTIDIIYSDNDNSTTGKQYIYRFVEGQTTKFVAGKDKTSSTQFSVTNGTIWNSSSVSNVGFNFFSYYGNNKPTYRTSSLTKTSSYSGYNNYLNNYYWPTTAPVEVGAGCKWSDIYYNDKTEYEYKQTPSSGSDVRKTLKGYSMVAGLPLMDVEKGNIITWNFEFNTELNGRKMYVKYGPFDGKTVEGDDITAFDADKKKNELKFTAKKSDMIFVKWGSGNTLITSGSATLIKETFKDN